MVNTKNDNQALVKSHEAGIAAGLKKALSVLGLKDLVENAKVDVRAFLVKDEADGKYYPEVSIKFPSDATVQVNKQTRTVSSIVALAMSAGDQDRLAAIRKLVPTYGTTEGETTLQKAVWKKMHEHQKDGHTVVLFANQDASILRGL